MRRHIKRADGTWGPKPKVHTPTWTVTYKGKERTVKAKSAKAAAYQVAEAIGRKFPDTRWPVQFTLSRVGRDKVHTIQVDAVYPDPDYVLTLID